MASKSKDAFLKIREILGISKKQVLKEIGLFFFEKTVELDYNRQIHQWYSFVLDIIDTNLIKSANVIFPKKKITTNVCSLNFVNKGTEDINVSKNFQKKDVIDSLHENIPVTTYKLTATIKNKVFYYK